MKRRPFFLTPVSRTATIFLVAVSVLVLSTAVAFYIMLVKAPSDLARNTAQGVKELFNFTPRVKIDQTIVVEQSTSILELATVSRTVWVDHTWNHQWMGSTKTLQMRGSFVAKAGFDLGQPFTFTIGRAPLRVKAELPPAQLLSLEMDEFKIVRDENGWWNRITEQDREEAVRELKRQAKEKVLGAGILTEARLVFEDRIAAMFVKRKTPLQFEHTPFVE